MQLLSTDHLEQLTDPANFLDNPFFFRDARRDDRRKQPYKSFFWMLLILGTLFGSACMTLFLLRDNGVGIPWFLGGAAGSTICIFICGIHTWFISAAARKHTAMLFMKEANQNTLHGLLTLPTPPFQMLFQVVFYPWLAAMRLALAGLPFYLIAVAMGGVGWIDLFMLYVVFAFISVSLPAWGRPILTGSSAFLSPLATAANSNSAVTGAATQNQTMAAGSGTTGGASAGPSAFLPLTFVMFGILPSLFQRGGIGGLYSTLHRYIPENILNLIPTTPFSWPLIGARALITPFDWFGLPLPPLLFVLASFVAGRYLAMVKVSEFLRVGTFRDLAGLPTYIPRRIWTGRLNIARLFVIMGYLWKWAITDGGFSPVVNSMTASREIALTGFVFLLFATAGWRTILRASAFSAWGRKEANSKDPLIVRKVEKREAWRFVIAPYAFATGFYLACCLMARTWPFPLSACEMAGKLFVIGVTGAALHFAAARVIPQLAFFSFLIVGAVFIGPPQLNPLASLSPTLGLLSLGNLTFFRVMFVGLRPPDGLIAFMVHPPAWWLWPVVCGASASLLMLWRKPAAAAVSSVEGEAQSPIVVDPTKVGDEVFSDHIYEKKDTAAKIDTPLALRFISIVQRLTDNAVAIKELRARLRGKLEAKNLKMSAVIAVAVSIAMLMAPTITGAIGGGIGQAFYGPPVTPLSLTASGTLVLWYMGILYMSVMLGMMFMGTAFAPETQKSTLGFLLLTPMKAASIVFGKAVGLLLSSGYTIGLLWLWTLVLSLAFSPTLGLASVLRVWGYVTATSLAVIMAVGACALAFAALTARSKKLAGCGVLALVLLPQVFIQLFIQLSVRRRRGGFRRRRPLNLPFHLDGPRLWMIFIVVCLVVSLIGFAVAVFGVRRMRKGDIVFEGAKQDN